MKVVIIGASFAGVSAALTIRKKYPEAVIYLVEKQATVGYLPGGLTLYYNEAVDTVEELRFVSEQQLKENRIELLLNAKVVSMDSNQQVIHYQRSDELNILSFDKLILATGSSQWSTKIMGSDSEKVLKYKFLPGVKQAIAQLENCKEVALIGGGQIGAEAADTLLSKGISVHLYERMDYLLFKYFDQEMILPVQQEMKKRGVVFHFDETVEKIVEKDDGLQIETQHSHRTVDRAVFAMNVRPDLSYLDEKIDSHTDQTVYVDHYLQTSHQNIFAIGDCIQVPYSLTNDSFYIPLVNNAVRAGAVVAQNILEPTTKFIGSLRTIGTKLVDYYVASTGLTEAEGLFHDQPIEVAHLKQTSSLFSGEKEISGKIIFEKESHRILGAQLVSKADILDKINTLALGIQTEQTLEQFYQKDFLYHPYFSTVMDITNQLAFTALWSDANEN
ncbi:MULTISPECIES: FAD-dependent oxidoreductase [unclassified Enterococcus]|uniref:FAD-dependent oxidoreductase n=1 Tax=unclassified Enterococcus TaxID=2608891 RepID=UPI001CE11FDB|nr:MULTISPECIES: FAD-dependent oxidoreductase [unclassified Enterococcus]MCA5011438.1 FAD-dependent oxidoreductase [Enterococcus sp. S23]MCA5015120.1 FAD-dependent oxidoreductase [Enterococcus sp. S22(2020)]